MHLDEQTAAVFQYFFDTLNGTVLTFLLAGVPSTKRNIRLMSLAACLCFSAVAVMIFARGLDNFSVVYALCVHLPFTAFFILVLHRPFSSTLLALILTYFLGAPRFIFGYLSLLSFRGLGLPLDDITAMRIGWGVTGPLLFLPVYKFLVPPLRELIASSASERPHLLALLGSCYVLSQALFGSMHQNLWSQLGILFVLAFLASLVAYSRKLHEMKRYNERMVAYSVKNEALSFYSESLAGYLQDTARLRHDQRHFLTLLDLHAARGDLQEIRRLIGENLAALDSRPEAMTGSNVVDGIFMLFRKRAGEEGVSIEVSGAGLVSLPLPENDLCLLLSNCLDNAIEATRLAEEGKRTVSLSVSHNPESGTVSLVVRNPCPRAVTFAEHGIPSSAKGPGHGYGTSSMRTIVTKHGGICGFSVENGEFLFRATFLPGRTSSAAHPFRSAPRPNRVSGRLLAQTPNPGEAGR